MSRQARDVMQAEVVTVPPDMPLSELGEVWEDTRSLIERAGLDLELK